jgi:hypothetical protein
VDGLFLHFTPRLFPRINSKDNGAGIVHREEILASCHVTGRLPAKDWESQMFKRTRTTLQNACAILESLELRRHLSVSVNIQGGTLIIDGDKNNNSITVIQDGANLIVSTDGTDRTITRRIDSIRITGGQGNDDIGVLLDATTIHNFSVDGGGGNDLISVAFSNAPNAPSTTANRWSSWRDQNDGANSINVDIQGGGGIDVIALNMVITANGAVQPTTTTAARGSDHHDWNHHDNNSNNTGFPNINVNVDAGAGDDTVDVRIALLDPAGTPTAAKTSGQSNDDDEDDDQTDGFSLGNFRVIVNGSGGNDTIAVGIASPDDLTNLGDNSNDRSRCGDNHRDRRDFLVQVLGDGGDDTLSLTVTGGLAGLKRAFQIDGGRGIDTSTTNLADTAVVIKNVETQSTTI